MTPDNQDQRTHFQQVEAIFTELCDMPRDNPDAIETRLRERAGNNQLLIDEVRDMLDLDRRASPVIDNPIIELDQDAIDEDDRLPDTIGQYTITGILGEGGMGIVYDAQQQSPKRRVALKVIRARSLHSKIKRRFQREAEILAKLNHPGIATIYESGITQEERTPYVAMELVEGEPITRYSEQHNLSIEQRVQLLVEVCRAVAYAHATGIIHRDLKPGNILVDRQGRPKVLDFGIAMDMQLDERTMITHTGQLLGTLQYMAPEQVDQSSKGSSARTDVYALGLIAFELLVGQSAHAGRDSSMYDLIRSIRDDEPDTLGTHDRALRGDLETIVAKALAREPERRYPEAGELADDLDRYLANKPIEARPPSTWYQLRKFSQRNPALVGSVASIMLVLVVAVILIANALRIANDERAIALAQQQAQELTALFVTEDLFAAGNPNYGGDASITLLDAMRAASGKIPDRFDGAPVAEASISATMGDQFRLMNDYERAESQLTRSLELSKQLSSLPPETLVSRYINLIDLYTDIDNLDQALSLAHELNEFIAGSESIPHESHVDALVQQASIHYYLRDLETASGLFERAVAIGETHAPDHTGTIDAIGALAMVYTNLERFDDAAPLHEKNIAMSAAALGPEHPATLQSMDNYAIQLYRNNQPEQARDLLKQVLEARLRVFGPDHHKTNLTRALIGRTTYLSGDFEDAEPILLDAYERLIQTLGSDHRYTLVCRDILHELYSAWDKPELAAEFTTRTPDPLREP